MNRFPENIDIPECAQGDTKAKLAIIASDITTQTKVDFPNMSPLYFKDSQNVNPAYYVRASSSIPMFFDPVIIERLPKGKEQVEEWQKIDQAFYFGNIPDKIAFVDGGIMSNFPIDIFHVTNRKPVRPTFGVKLGIDRESENINNSVADIIWNCFSAARQMRDHDVILKNPDFIRLIANINDNNINWLDFNLSDENKLKLFRRGVIAACSFLKDFEWEEYKKLRTVIYNLKKENKHEIMQYKYSKSFIKKK